MSAAAAYALPEHAPQPGRSDDKRHIEIVTSRGQRRARPRLAYSLIIIAGLFAVLASQLLLSIALADGAYQISALQAQQKELSRAQQSITEELNVLESPQNLAARAESLGLVSNTSAVYLNLANGAVMGSPSAAQAGAGSVVGANGSLLIPNSLLDGVPSSMTPSVSLGAAQSETGTAGAPDGSPATNSVTSTSTGIPGPSTR
jgi:cell division protein FtsB